MGRISVFPQQIGVLGVRKAFVHSHGLLSCSGTWQIATEP